MRHFETKLTQRIEKITTIFDTLMKTLEEQLKERGIESEMKIRGEAKTKVLIVKIVRCDNSKKAHFKSIMENFSSQFTFQTIGSGFVIYFPKEKIDTFDIATIFNQQKVTRSN
jgi:hypothetical protein